MEQQNNGGRDDEHDNNQTSKTNNNLEPTPLGSDSLNMELDEVALNYLIEHGEFPLGQDRPAEEELEPIPLTQVFSQQNTPQQAAVVDGWTGKFSYPQDVTDQYKFQDTQPQQLPAQHLSPAPQFPQPLYNTEEQQQEPYNTQITRSNFGSLDDPSCAQQQAIHYPPQPEYPPPQLARQPFYATTSPQGPPYVVTPSPPPQQPFAHAVPPAPTQAAQLLGKDILITMPGSFHFVTGWSNFHHLDNDLFQEIVRHHLQEKLSASNDNNTRISLKGEVHAVLEKARDHALNEPGRQCQRLRDVRIWKVAGEKKNNWAETVFEDVTADTEFVEKKLSKAVMDTELRNLRRRKAAPSSPTPKENPVEPSPEFKQLNVDEHEKTTEICNGFNCPGIHICSLFTIKECYAGMEANEYLANKIIPVWQAGADKRLAIKIDCDQRFMADSYNQARLDLVALHQRYAGNTPRRQPDPMDDDAVDTSQPRSKRLRPSYEAAASAFFEAFLRLFPRGHECVLVFKNVPHPKIFEKRFLPVGWFDNDFCKATIRGVLLVTAHPSYQGDMGPRLGTITQHLIAWKPRDVSNELWLERRTESTLPFRGERVAVSPLRIDADLEDDGAALALIDCEHPDQLANKLGINLCCDSRHHCELANKIAIQWGHRWKSAPTDGSTHRCVFRMNADNDTLLRESYYTAMRKVTHSSAMCPIGNPHDSTVQDMGDALMSLMKKMADCSVSLPAEKRFTRRWGMVFTGASTEPFHIRFPSQESNWWNSDCRFLVATCCNNVIRVEYEEESDEHIGPIPTRRVEDVVVVAPEAHVEPRQRDGVREMFDLY